MQNTEERLLLGAKIYHEGAALKIQAEMQKPPSVTYPDKVLRVYFDRVIEKGRNEFAIVFIQRTFFKKIERYRQVNYRKYPVYSSTHWKDKRIEIKIRPNPSLFDGLRNSDNPDLAKNAMPIIACFLDPKLFPSWAQEKFLDLAHKAVSNETAASSKVKLQTAEAELRTASHDLQLVETKLADLLQRKETLEAAMEKHLKKAVKSGFHQHKYIASALSLGLASPKRKTGRAKKKAAFLQRELSDLLTEYEETIITYKQSVVRETEARNALNHTNAQCAHAKAIEDAQFAFDKSNVHQPFIGSMPPADPPMPEWTKAEAEYKFESLTKEVKVEASDFLPFDDPTFTKYYGFQVVGILVIRNKEANAFFAGMTFDIGSGLMKLAKVKKGRYKDRELRQQWLDAQFKDRLFDVLVIVSPNKESLLEQLKYVLDTYRAKFIAI